MAIEAQGSGSLGTNPTGIGAVYFGDMPDLLKNQQEAIDTEKDYAVLRQRQKAQSAAEAQALRNAFDVTEGEALPKHLPGIQNAISQLKEGFAKGFEMYGSNLTSPDAQKYFNNLRFEKNKIEQAVKTSQGIYHAARAGSEKFNPKTDDPSSLNNIKAALASSYEDLLSGNVPTDFTAQPIKGTLNEFLGSYLKPYNEKMQTQKGIEFGKYGKGDITEQETTYNFKQGDAIKFANDIYSTDRNGAEIADEQWGLESDDVKKTYLDKYTDPNIADGVAEVKAKKDWLADVILTRQIMSEKEAFKGQEAGYKEGVKFGYGQKTEAIKGRRFPELVSALALGDPNLMRKVPLVGDNGILKNPDGSEKTVYGTTIFNQFPLKEKRSGGIIQVDGKQQVLPPENDHITLAFKDDATGKIHVETKFSREDYAEKKKATPYIKFNTPQEFMDYMGNSASGIKELFGTPDQWTAFLDMKGARVGQTDFDPTKVIDWTPEKGAEAEKKKGAKNVYVPVAQQKAASQKQYTIKGKAYPESKIAEKAKASGMTIQEYVNELNKQ